jgi:hypothetical protein
MIDYFCTGRLRGYNNLIRGREWLALAQSIRTIVLISLSLKTKEVDYITVIKNRCLDKVYMYNWWEHFTGGHIAISASRWTTNELCFQDLMINIPPY